MAPRDSTFRRVAMVVGALALGLLLLACLVKLMAFDVSELAPVLRQAKPAYFLAMVGCTFLHFWLTAWKWRTVTHVLKSGARMKGGYFPYSALIAVTAQFLPLQLSMLTVRSLAMRLHEDIPTSKSATSTLFDQFFDFLVPAILLVPALLALGGLISMPVGLALSVVGIILGGVIVIALGSRAIALSFTLAAHIPLVGGIAGKVAGAAVGGEGVSLFHRPVMGKLYTLSALRYGNLLFRSYLVVLAAGLDIGFAPVAFANTVVILSIVISITPASLGVAEWGWVGVLSACGVAGSAATEFALLNRIFMFLAVLTAGLIVALGLVVRHLLRDRKAA